VPVGSIKRKQRGESEQNSKLFETIPAKVTLNTKHEQQKSKKKMIENYKPYASFSKDVLLSISKLSATGEHHIRRATRQSNSMVSLILSIAGDTH
jgi:hypothetical protein